MKSCCLSFAHLGKAKNNYEFKEEITLLVQNPGVLKIFTITWQSRSWHRKKIECWNSFFKV